MTNFNYLKISTTRKIRYLKHHQKNATYIVFLDGFMSDLEGKKPKVQIYWESRAKIMGIRNNNFKIKSNEKRNI